MDVIQLEEEDIVQMEEQIGPPNNFTEALEVIHDFRMAGLVPIILWDIDGSCLRITSEERMYRRTH